MVNIRRDRGDENKFVECGDIIETNTGNFYWVVENSEGYINFIDIENGISNGIVEDGEDFGSVTLGYDVTSGQNEKIISIHKSGDIAVTF